MYVLVLVRHAEYKEQRKPELNFGADVMCRDSGIKGQDQEANADLSLDLRLPQWYVPLVVYDRLQNFLP